MIGQILVGALALVALLIAAVSIFYVVSYLVLSGVGVLFPLAGRGRRKKRHR